MTSSIQNTQPSQEAILQNAPSKTSPNKPIKDSLSSQKPPSTSIGLIETVLNFLRMLRDALFSGFLSIDSQSEHQKLQSIAAVKEQLENSSLDKAKAKQLLFSISEETRRFIEEGVRKILLSDPQYSKKYPHAQAFLEENPQSKDVLQLLGKFNDNRREIMELAKLIPFVQDRGTPLSSLIEHFGKLPQSLQNKILLTMAKIQNLSKATLEEGRLLLATQRNLLRTAIATAVRGLKMNEDEHEWHKNGWRCRLWYN